MSKIVITTDANSGITADEAAKAGIPLLAMPFIVDGREYFEGVDCTYERFFEMLEGGADVSTSQPSVASLTDFWKGLLKEYDSIVHIPMSSALSSSCATAKAIAEEFGGRVFVVDNKRISISQRTSVYDGMALAKQGMSAEQIAKTLEEQSYDNSIYLAVNTLELLKKSGRVTKAGAALATVLNLKPVLQIQGGKLDAFAKVRGMANAENTMLEAAKKDLETRFKGQKVRIDAAYSGDEAPALEWLEKMRGYFVDNSIELHRLPISICCHVGAGVKALGCIRYVD